jgi:hypothetical protein
MSASEYQKRQEGNAVVFSVVPAPQKRFMFIIIMGGLLALLGLSFFSSAHLLGFIAMAGGGTAIWWGWTKDIRPVEYRSPSTFRVSGESIQSNGKTFARADIHRLIIKNGLTDEEVGVPNLLIETPRAQAMGMAHRAEVSRTAHGLSVEMGGRGYVLAGGLDKTTAYGLLTDVSRVLGMGVV